MADPAEPPTAAPAAAPGVSTLAGGVALDKRVVAALACESYQDVQQSLDLILNLASRGRKDEVNEQAKQERQSLFRGDATRLRHRVHDGVGAVLRQPAKKIAPASVEVRLNDSTETQCPAGTTPTRTQHTICWH